MSEPTPIESLPASLTVAESAQRTGLSEKALRRRIERKTLRSVRGRDGLLRIPTSDLQRAGLVIEELSGTSVRGTMGQRPRGDSPRGHAISIEAFSAALDRIERQAEELGRLRLLTAESESLRERALEEERARKSAEMELLEVRAELGQLRAQLAEGSSTTTVDRSRWSRWFGRT